MRLTWGIFMVLCTFCSTLMLLTILHVESLPTASLTFQRKNVPLQKKFGVPTIEHKNLSIVQSAEEPSFYLLSHRDRFPHADGDNAQRKIAENIGLREKCKQDPSTIVVDIGGYLGDFGLSAAAMGCTVYIFEPTPFQYWLIRGSIALNGFQNNCFAFNYAISSTEAILKFEQSEGQTNQVPLLDTDDTSNPENGTFYMHSVPLDTVLPTEKIFLMKVDVEGFEPTVLFEGSKKILEEHRVDHLITEYTPWWVEDGKGPWEDFLPKLKKVAGDKATLFALHRTESRVYGPITEGEFSTFWSAHLELHLQTDIYVDFTGQFQSHKRWGVSLLA